MGFVISQLTTMQTKEMTSNAEYLLTLLMNELTNLTRREQSIIERQNALGQAYMQNHLDEEGEVDINAIEYINSSAFAMQFEAELKALQAKEQILQLQKTQLENLQKQNSNLNESWGKTRDKNITDTFKYFQ